MRWLKVGHKVDETRSLKLALCIVNAQPQRKRTNKDPKLKWLGDDSMS